ncbi:trimeric LpxA-like protein [Emericellopsis atlantica]|uniref:Dynactin subunit 6 n=1 Tax=Emericellopsis atlantica TaxID=2614577 RepID=A0A9P7ZRD6_9HYPO|nr:trimeric LpxA-like protein [Emericellopsis atlantica]KAG9256825.1 trimeric LpxA-like protein [Emericellopsis atlantica]
MSTAKRQSTVPAGPKPPVNFSSTVTIPKDAVLQGTHSITIQSETLIHPRARLDSNLGSILVGRRSIVQERAQIGVEPQNIDAAVPGGVSLGDYVVVEVNAVIEAGGTEIGDGSVVQVGSRIGSGAKIGKDCTIAARATVAPGTVLPDQTVVLSNGQQRADKRLADARKLSTLKQINVVRKMIRNDQDKFK